MLTVKGMRAASTAFEFLAARKPSSIAMATAIGT